MFVIIESPYAGDIERNTRYARAAMLDSLFRGESPFASHLLYPQVLFEDIPWHRKLGIEAGLALYEKADKVAFYLDLGWSPGMEAARLRAKKSNLQIVERRIP